MKTTISADGVNVRINGKLTYSEIAGSRARRARAECHRARTEWYGQRRRGEALVSRAPARRGLPQCRSRRTSIPPSTRSSFVCVSFPARSLISLPEGRSPLDAPQHSPTGIGSEVVPGFANGRQSCVHRLGDTIRGVTRNILRDSPGIEVASGPVSLPSKAFSFLKDLIRNGDGDLHTSSMTPITESAKTALPVEQTHGCEEKDAVGSLAGMVLSESATAPQSPTPA